MSGVAPKVETVFKQTVYSSMRSAGLLLALPVVVILCLQVGLFVWTASHGIDFTDESYYLLSILHWRELTATATFFGAYFEWPFRLFGQHVAAIRIFGLALLLLGGSFVAWRAMVFMRHDDFDGSRTAMLPFVVGGMGSALFYYSYVSTLRVPSYNMLVLFCLMVGTGLMLYIVDGHGTRQRVRTAAFAYGLLLGACSLTKAHSAAAMVLCHGLFFAFFFRRQRAIELIGLAFTGVMLNFALLQLLQPRWVEVLSEGVLAYITMDSTYAGLRFAALWDAVVRGAERLLVELVFAALIFYAVVQRWGRTRPALLSWLVVLLVAGMVLTIELQGNGKSWWALMIFGTALLWLCEHLCRDRAARRNETRSALGLTVLLFALPIAYSIGTDNPLPAHTRMATVFAVIAIMLPLRHLWMRGLIHWCALACALTLLCLPTLVSQIRSMSDPKYTYRLRVGLMDHQLPARVGALGDTLILDGLTRDSIANLVGAMRDAGYTPGEPILDVTGDGPGLVYVLGGRPVGVAWLVGGYPGSERLAAQVMNSVPRATLRKAWVLSSPDNRGALKFWAHHLVARTGGVSHQPAGKVVFYPQHGARGPNSDPVTLYLWRPVKPGPASPSGVAP